MTRVVEDGGVKTDVDIEDEAAATLSHALLVFDLVQSASSL
jgi:hypothetical protein